MDNNAVCLSICLKLILFWTDPLQALKNIKCVFWIGSKTFVEVHKQQLKANFNPFHRNPILIVATIYTYVFNCNPTDSLSVLQVHCFFWWWWGGVLNFFKVTPSSNVFYSSQSEFYAFWILASRCPPRPTCSNCPVCQGKLSSTYLMACYVFSPAL